MIFVGNVCVSGRGQMSNLRTRAIEKKGGEKTYKKKKKHAGQTREYPGRGARLVAFLSGGRRSS